VFKVKLRAVIFHRSVALQSEKISLQHLLLFQLNRFSSMEACARHRRHNDDDDDWLKQTQRKMTNDRPRLERKA